MRNRMTSMLPEDRAWRREQMERSNDIESLALYDADDQAFADQVFAGDMTPDEKIAAGVAYFQAKNERVASSERLKKAC